MASHHLSVPLAATTTTTTLSSSSSPTPPAHKFSHNKIIMPFIITQACCKKYDTMGFSKLKKKLEKRERESAVKLWWMLYFTGMVLLFLSVQSVSHHLHPTSHFCLLLMIIIITIMNSTALHTCIIIATSMLHTRFIISDDPDEPPSKFYEKEQQKSTRRREKNIFILLAS